MPNYGMQSCKSRDWKSVKQIMGVSIFKGKIIFQWKKSLDRFWRLYKTRKILVLCINHLQIGFLANFRILFAFLVSRLFEVYPINFASSRSRDCRPKYASHPTLFQTWPKIPNSISDLTVATCTLWYCVVRRPHYSERPMRFGSRGRSDEVNGVGKRRTGTGETMIHLSNWLPGVRYPAVNTRF